MGGGQYAGGGGAPEETPFFSSLTDSAPPLPSPGSALTGLNMGKTGWNQFPLASPGSAPIPSPATLLNVGGAPFSARDFAAATPSAATGGLQTPTSWADGLTLALPFRPSLSLSLSVLFRFQVSAEMQQSNRVYVLG